MVNMQSAKLRRSLALFATVSALTLSSCASLQGQMDGVMSSFKPEKTVVDAKAEALAQDSYVAQPAYSPDRLPQTDWVAAFGDPGLSVIVDEALEVNPNIALARGRLDASRAASVQARSGFFPNVSGSLTGSHSEFGNDLVGDTNRLSTGIDVSWEADLWGRIRDGANAGELEVLASEADYAGARLSIAGNVSLAWFDLIEAKLQVGVSERNLETQQRALDLTQRRFSRGVANSADVRLARSSVASAEASLASRKQQRDAAARRVEILLRRYPTATLSSAADLPALPALPAIGSPADLLIYRPDLIAAEARMDAQGLRVDVARKALLPSLRFTGDGSFSGDDIGNLFDIDSLIATIGAGLTAPIFQGGRLNAEVDRQDAVLRQQMASYSDTVLNAYLEVENALDADRRLEEREIALRTSLDEARLARDRIERQYLEGLTNFLQLLDAQSRVFQAESALISARRERLSNRVRLHMALGGGLYGAPVGFADNATTITGGAAAN